MHWSALLFAALAGSAQSMDVATTAPVSAAYSSYTQAWNAAHEAERPMLVILNPGVDSDGKRITEAQLRADENVEALLDQYVVAVIDTTTQHGKQVNELFGSPALPRVVVIDKAQKKQIFQSSAELSNDKIATVLKEHKDGIVKYPVSAPATQTIINNNKSLNLPSYGRPTYNNCPSCQPRYTF